LSETKSEFPAKEASLFLASRNLNDIECTGM
jgi:hypothetical protein